MLEADFQNNVVQLATTLGWLIHHDRRQDLGIGGDAGFPDLVLARRGIVHFMELKNERGKLSDHQLRWINELKVGARYSVGVYRPGDIDLIGKLLSRRET